MKILVTGGAGFIGSHVVERLVAAGGSEVAVIDDFNSFYDPSIKHGNLARVADQVELIQGDICDRELVDQLFARHGFDKVIHLAARAGVRPSIQQPELYLRVNINGTFNLLEAARRNGVKHFVFASSSSVYGINKKVPFSEADPILRTISPYAATKMAGEQLCSNYSHLFDMRAVCLRFFTVYGPRQRPDLAISRFVRLIDEGKPIERYGDGATGRDYTYVSDIVEGVVGALSYQGQPFSIFNLGGSHAVSLSELILEVEQAMGRKAEIVELPQQPGDVPYTFADVSKAKQELGYQPKVPIHEGIRRYVDWYFSQRRLETGY